MGEHDGIESSDAAIEQQRGDLRVSLTGVDEHSVIARSYEDRITLADVEHSHGRTNDAAMRDSNRGESGNQHCGHNGHRPDAASQKCDCQQRRCKTGDQRCRRWRGMPSGERRRDSIDPRAEAIQDAHGIEKRGAWGGAAQSRYDEHRRNHRRQRQSRQRSA